MKLKVMTERECCEPVDLVAINDDGVPLVHYSFCKHCGRHHELESFTDAAGSRDTRWEPLPWPWEKAGEQP